jgi:hypothetical protein
VGDLSGRNGTDTGGPTLKRVRDTSNGLAGLKQAQVFRPDEELAADTGGGAVFDAALGADGV